MVGRRTAFTVHWQAGGRQITGSMSIGKHFDKVDSHTTQTQTQGKSAELYQWIVPKKLNVYSKMTGRQTDRQTSVWARTFYGLDKLENFMFVKRIINYPANVTINEELEHEMKHPETSRKGKHRKSDEAERVSWWVWSRFLTGTGFYPHHVCQFVREIIASRTSNMSQT